MNISVGYSTSSLGRVNSLDVLCSLDIIKFPSAPSMDGLNMYGQLNEDPFLWSNNPGAGSNASGGLYGGSNYRSLSQSNNSFSRSSLWPSMYNLVSTWTGLFALSLPLSLPLSLSLCLSMSLSFSPSISLSLPLFLSISLSKTLLFFISLSSSHTSSFCLAYLVFFR